MMKAGAARLVVRNRSKPGPLRYQRSAIRLTRQRIVVCISRAYTIPILSSGFRINENIQRLANRLSAIVFSGPKDRQSIACAEHARLLCGCKSRIQPDGGEG